MTSDPKEALELIDEWVGDSMPTQVARDLAVYCRTLIAEREGLEREVEKLTKERDDARRIAMAERSMCDSVMRYRDEYLARAEAAESKLSTLEEAAQNFVVVAHSSSQSGDRFWEACDALEKLCSTPAALLHPTVPVETK